MYAIIGGSGLARLSVLTQVRREVMRTPYGEPSGALTFGTLAGREVVFLARHGYGHTLPPHEINYRANLWALKELQVRGVIVGGGRYGLLPGAQPILHERDLVGLRNGDATGEHLHFTTGAVRFGHG